MKQASVLAGVLLAAVLLTTGWAAQAHETTRSYVTLARSGQAVDARFQVAFRDIEVAAWMDENLDGQISWGEARQRLDVVDAYLRSGFSLDAGGPCTLTRTGAGAVSQGGADYLELRFAGDCPSADAPLTARSRLFAEIDPDHRLFVQASIGGASTSTILSRTDPSAEFTGGSGGGMRSFASYFRSGVGHLLGGADHLVFLLALMLPAVYAAQGARRAAIGVLAAVTGFTIAHALTLSAAATDLLRPPGDLIEILIALSIVVTAIDNVRPFIPAPRAAVAAFFGIIHGFGFASALGVLELTGAELAVALLGFNLGIEAAQVAVVLVCLPAIYMLGGGRVVLWIGSAGAGLIGLWWVLSRVAPLGPFAGA